MEKHDPIPDDAISQTAAKDALVRWAMFALLIAGIALRFAVFLTCFAFNPDRHFQVIQYIVEHHALPYSNMQIGPAEWMSQSYHPPLYYVLMAPLYAYWQDPAPLHFASFILSSLNLLLIRKMLNHPLVFPNHAGRLIAMGIACFLPEFVMFNGFISNDALTLPVGTLIFMTALHYLLNPRAGTLLWMAVAIAIGLLTKGTFLFVGPMLALLVLLIESRHGWGAALRKAAIFCLIFSVLGCYKYVENYIHFDRPIVHNLDLGGSIYEMQVGTWKGWQTVYDINVFKLIRRPVLKIHDTYSYPLLFYGTFWYQHIPESSYNGNIHGYQWIGSIIYLLAIIPTLVFLMGFGRGVLMSIRVVGLASAQRAQEPRLLVVAAAMLLLLANLIVVMSAGIKYDAWSCFQSRLYFQSMMPVLVLFGLGTEMLPGPRWLRQIVRAICWATVAACVMYFIVEIALTNGLLPMGPELQP